MLPVPLTGPLIEVFAREVRRCRTPPAESFRPGMLRVAMFVAISLAETFLLRDGMAFMQAYFALVDPACVRACMKSRRASRAFEGRLFQDGACDAANPNGCM